MLRVEKRNATNKNTLAVLASKALCVTFNTISTILNTFINMNSFIRIKIMD